MTAFELDLGRVVGQSTSLGVSYDSLVLLDGEDGYQSESGDFSAKMLGDAPPYFQTHVTVDEYRILEMYMVVGADNTEQQSTETSIYKLQTISNQPTQFVLEFNRIYQDTVISATISVEKSEPGYSYWIRGQVPQPVKTLAFHTMIPRISSGDNIIIASLDELKDYFSIED